MIKSHYITHERLHSRITMRVEKCITEQVIQIIQKHPDDKMYHWMTVNLEAFAEEVAYHNYQETEDAWLYLYRAMQLGVGIFQSNANDGQGFPFAFNNDYIDVTGKKTSDFTSETEWFQALYCAIITRNQIAINELVSVNNTVFAESDVGDQMKTFNFARVDLYRAIFTGGDLASTLVKATESFAPESYHDDAYFYVSRLTWPQIAIIRTIFSTNAQDEFNEAMEKALLLHQEYYSHEDNQHDAAGVIPLPLAALAALAYDHKGYKFTVPNNYIPTWLTERD